MEQENKEEEEEKEGISRGQSRDYLFMNVYIVLSAQGKNDKSSKFKFGWKIAFA